MRILLTTVPLEPVLQGNKEENVSFVYTQTSSQIEQQDIPVPPKIAIVLSCEMDGKAWLFVRYV